MFIAEKAYKPGWTAFREPDMKDALTAIAGLNKMDECKELKLL